MEKAVCESRARLHQVSWYDEFNLAGLEHSAARRIKEHPWFLFKVDDGVNPAHIGLGPRVGVPVRRAAKHGN
jgi:hypothetical protein